MKNSRILLVGLSLALVMGVGACTTSNAKNSPDDNGQMMNKKMMEKMQQGMMTPEMHEEMAGKHKKASACLKSGKSQQACMPMMGKDMMGGPGMMKGKMMKNIDQCMAGVKDKKMNQQMMDKMKGCMMQGMTDQGQKKEMSEEEHKSHH